MEVGLNNSVSSNIATVINEAAKAAANNDAKGMENAVRQLKNLMIGDIFTGKINSLEEGKASIELSNGNIVNASLLNNLNATKGQSLMFMVSANQQDKISLKVLDSNSQEMIMIDKALKAASMATNDSSVTMVKALLNNNMPIDKKTLNDMSKLILNNPEASVDTLVRMTKMSIPITEGNIAAFESYRNYEHQITNIAEDIYKDINALIEDNPAGMSKLMNNAADILEGEKIILSKDNLTEIQKSLDSIDHPEAKSLSQKLLTENINAKELFDTLSKISESSDENNNSLLDKLMKSGELKNAIKEVLDKNFSMSTDEIADKEKVKKFYEALTSKTHNLSDLLEKSGNNTGNLYKNVTAMKDNLNFMNELNHNMAFLQLPVKLNSGTKQGDLYVYSNKKNLREHPDNLSALLHLDMDNLGPMDVLVKLNGKKVNTNFTLESEEMLDFIGEHIDELNARIDKLGYDFKFTMNVKEEQKEENKESTSMGPVRFTDDFTDQLSPLMNVKSYIFDSKA